MSKVRTWFCSLASAGISGIGGGIINGFAAMQIAPDHFNWQDPQKLVQMVLASTICTAVIGVAMFLRQSPLPSPE